LGHVRSLTSAPDPRPGVARRRAHLPVADQRPKGERPCFGSSSASSCSVIAIAGGAIVHPILFALAILALVAFFAGSADARYDRVGRRGVRGGRSRDLAEAAGIAVRGELELATAAHCPRPLDEAIRATSGPFVIDLANVGFLDSSGIACLIAARALLGREDRALGLICPPAAPAARSSSPGSTSSSRSTARATSSTRKRRALRPDPHDLRVVVGGLNVVLGVDVHHLGIPLARRTCQRL
jgi:anti-anti-sigma factor